MSQYRTIYDPNGVPFEVTPERAAELVLNLDWSNTPPKSKTAKKGKAPAEQKDETAPTADTEVNEASADAASSESG